MVLGGHGARQEPQAPGESQVLLNHGRDVKAGGSEEVRAGRPAATAPFQLPVGAAAPHPAVPPQLHRRALAEAPPRRPGLGGVGAVGGRAERGHPGGTERGSRGPLLSARPSTPRQARFLPLPRAAGGAELGPQAGECRALGYRPPPPRSPPRRASGQSDTNFSEGELRLAVRKHRPEIVVVIATEVSSLFPAPTSS